MSYAKYPNCEEGKRNQQDRSRKDCLCGGHSAKDVRKNRHHHATIMRWFQRVERQFKLTQRKYTTDLGWLTDEGKEKAIEVNNAISDDYETSDPIADIKAAYKTVTRRK